MDSYRRKYHGYINESFILHFHKYGEIRPKMKTYVPGDVAMADNLISTGAPKKIWLQFIDIFFSSRVMKVALKFGVAVLVSIKYERIGLALMMLCLAF